MEGFKSLLAGSKGTQRNLSEATGLDADHFVI